MKKLICFVLTFVMIVSLCVPMSAAAAEAETPFVPESYTREELLEMDPEVDSDGDGLVDVIELVYKMNRYNADTDGDGVTDYTEFCITCTDPLTPDGQIDTDGDGLTNAQEAVYGTNPDDLDSDNDNLGDYAEITLHMTNPTAKDTDGDGVYDATELEHGLNPLAAKTDGITPDAQRPEVAEQEEVLINSGVSSLVPGNSVGTNAVDPSITPVGPGTGSSPTVYSTTLNTDYDGTQYSSSVSYRFSSSWFFDDNNEYNQDLAITSSLLAAITYDDNYLSNTVSDPDNSIDAVENWFLYHGFTDVVPYDLNDTETDQHVSEMFVAYKTISDGTTTKNLIAIAIRGTNGTLDEWQSNFDVGGASTPHSEWTAELNHMGFDITVNRLSTALSSYMSARGLNKTNSILWFTGHSRGGALANLLAAKRVNADYEVFAYTFASPGTTVSTNTKATKYCCIFNIINEDDLVPKLPLSDWDFVRYGEDVPGSIEDSYAGQWDALVSGSENYTSNPTAMGYVIDDFETIADDRNACYTYRTGDNAYYLISYDSVDVRDAQHSIQILMYPKNVSGLHYTTNGSTAIPLAYYSKIYQKPAFLMQLIAAYKGEEITEPAFGLIGVAQYMSEAKAQLIAFSKGGGMDHPHYTESYYLLATKLT